MSRPRFATAMALVLVLACAAASYPQAAKDGGRPLLPPGTLGQPVVRDVEGTVKRVDTSERTVELASEMLGIFGATLRVTDETRIEVNGKPAALADLPEGALARASYEMSFGRKIARSIIATPASPPGGSGLQ
ncbi:MAG: hypothetical protein L0027_17375 [Candidatus Rokubacteria bacterium]|nr:hypothetical protein [Candidatus Rokubacteria bacterium]